jgi:acetyl-CoA carboxylase biotin carboxyl carrier protein
MKVEEIRDLINFIAQSPLDEVNIETDEFKINVKRNSGVPTYEKATYVQPQVQIQPQTQVQVQPQITPQVNAEVSTPVATTTNVSGNAGNYITVKSPMIGTFYRSSKPDAPLFVNVGDEIKAGQTVCIIEAMKLFNEIESEVAGTIVKVNVENASPVEYDQVLFLVDPA